MPRDYYIELTGDTRNPKNIFQFGTDTSNGVDGFYKAISQWLKCLFTEKGSFISDSNYGTGFTQLIGGNVRSVEHAEELIHAAIQEATTQVQFLQQQAAVPDEEAIASVTPLGVTGDLINGVTVQVLIRNNAGKVLSLSVSSTA